MKTRSLIVAAAVALIAVSCSPKVSDKTTITGDLGANAPESVELSIKDANVLINVPVTDGKFTAEIPACQTGIARIKVGNLVNNFVSDGTPLDVTMTDGMTLNITSKYPKISTQAAYEILQKGLLDLQKNYQPKIQAAVSEEMQNSVQVGDEIVTNGGIVGIIVRTGEDTVVIETGGERNKMRIKTWAISENITAAERAKEAAPKKSESPLALGGVADDDSKKSKKKKKNSDE